MRIGRTLGLLVAVVVIAFLGMAALVASQLSEISEERVLRTELLKLESTKVAAEVTWLTTPTPTP